MSVKFQKLIASTAILVAAAFVAVGCGGDDDGGGGGGQDLAETQELVVQIGDETDAGVFDPPKVAYLDSVNRLNAMFVNLYRFNDDGEPGGTAGRPILAAIEGQGLDRVAVVVTRWYGGIKLGAGGLVRAYGGAASECLRTAARQPLVAVCEVHVAYPFEDTGAVHAALATHDAEKLDERFDAGGGHVHLRLPVDRVDALVDQLRDATRDRARVRIEGDASTQPL